MFLNEREYKALLYLPPRAQVIYLMELRQCMSYATGVVGRPPREICLDGLRELLEVSAKYTANNKKQCANVRDVRTALDQLKRAGLIVRLKGARRNDVETLVFLLPLAAADKTVTNSHVRVTSGPSRQGVADAITSGGAASEGDYVGVTSGQKRQKTGSHVTHLINHNKKGEGVDSFVDNSVRGGNLQVADNFKPCAKTLAGCAKMKCPEVNKTHIELFKVHHKTQKTLGSVEDFQNLFYKWMIIAKNMSGKATHKSRSTSKPRSKPKPTLPKTESGLKALAHQLGVSTDCKTWPELRVDLAKKIMKPDGHGG